MAGRAGRGAGPARRLLAEHRARDHAGPVVHGPAGGRAGAAAVAAAAGHGVRRRGGSADRPVGHVQADRRGAAAARPGLPGGRGRRRAPGAGRRGVVHRRVPGAGAGLLHDLLGARRALPAVRRAERERPDGGRRRLRHAAPAPRTAAAVPGPGRAGARPGLPGEVQGLAAAQPAHPARRGPEAAGRVVRRRGGAPAAAAGRGVDPAGLGPAVRADPRRRAQRHPDLPLAVPDRLPGLLPGGVGQQPPPDHDRHAEGRLPAVPLHRGPAGLGRHRAR